MAPANDTHLSPLHQDAAFGHYISGFTDGEGAFILIASRKARDSKRVKAGTWQRDCRFQLKLRYDDAAILYAIREYFGAGNILFGKAYKTAKPQIKLVVNGCLNCYRKILPHFDKYQLRAKKRADYEIWRQAVVLSMTIYKRRFHASSCPTGGRRIGKWTEADHEEFMRLRALLRSNRIYDPSKEPLVISKAVSDRQLPLFN